jgi:two-component system, OmpR family, sensor histidine kinase TctE
VRRLDGWSLEHRLLGGFLVALALITVGLYLMLAGYAGRAADRAFDRLLLASALTVADSIRVEDGRVSVDLPYASLAMLAVGRRDRIFYRITGPDGSLITGYPDLAPGLPPARSDAPRFGDVSYRGAELRAVALGRFVAAAGGSWVTIVMAHTRDERTTLAAEILANAFQPVVMIALVASGLLWFGVRRALAPLAAIERVVRRREPTDLSPIEMPVPAEVRQLLTALNHFMQRLQANLGLMQTFLADAAHQIRTPLAALRAQADLAVEEDDASSLRSYVHKIHRNAALASQVTNQLLSHTLVAHRGQTAARERVDLIQLLRQVAYRAEARGSGPPVELDLRRLERPAVIEGDPVTLREAFANLLDNAAKYAGDRYPVQIAVTATPEDRIIAVEFADRGPGIPDTEKGRVLERFARGSSGQGVTGSGLGLAIVKAVSDAHAAGLTLGDRRGGGLVVRLRFRAAARNMASAAPTRAAGWLLTTAAAMLVGDPPAHAIETFSYPATAKEEGHLLVHAATDRSAIEPLLRDFQETSVGTRITYVDMNTIELFRSVVEPQGGTGPDLVVSSAMDLQAKLVNDGWTQPHVSEMTKRVPGWANWRNEAFGFTLEPAVIVYNRGGLGELEVPRSRPELIGLLQSQPDRFRGRVATYDLARSGVGYLFATQDSVLSSQYWRLALALGDVSTRLLASSAEILDAVERGGVLIGYNVLGSYARSRQLAGAPVGIVLPLDYTLVMSRVVTIPKAARNPAAAKLLIDHILSDRGQRVVAGATAMQAIVPPDGPATSVAGPMVDAAGSVHPITLSPSLLVFLDPLKQSRFLANWSETVRHP